MCLAHALGSVHAQSDQSFSDPLNAVAPPADAHRILQGQVGRAAAAAERQDGRAAVLPARKRRGERPQNGARPRPAHTHTKRKPNPPLGVAVPKQHRRPARTCQWAFPLQLRVRLLQIHSPLLPRVCCLRTGRCAFRFRRLGRCFSPLCSWTAQQRCRSTPPRASPCRSWAVAAAVAAGVEVGVEVGVGQLLGAATAAAADNTTRLSVACTSCFHRRSRCRVSLLLPNHIRQHASRPAGVGGGGPRPGIQPSDDDRCREGGGGLLVEVVCPPSCPPVLLWRRQ